MKKDDILAHIHIALEEYKYGKIDRDDAIFEIYELRKKYTLNGFLNGFLIGISIAIFIVTFLFKNQYIWLVQILT